MEKCQERLDRLEKILKKASGERPNKKYQTSYGSLTALNTSRLILDSVGEEMLEEIAGDYLDLLETSSAIYEKNGDYALGIFSSGWCQFLDTAARNLCHHKDLKDALACGKWECHESCWNKASKESIIQKKPVDVECSGGIRLYAVPVFASGEIVGSINFGYGDPPKDPGKLKEIAGKYNVSAAELAQRAEEYEPRPQYIIDMAKRRLQMTAKLIGAMVELKQRNEELDKMNRIFTGRELKMIELKKEIEALKKQNV